MTARPAELGPAGALAYGRSGALIDSVGEVGASYFAQVSHDHGLPWLAVVPLADAVALPACPWPGNVIFIDALHGGLLGRGRRLADAPASACLPVLSMRVLSLLRCRL